MSTLEAEFNNFDWSASEDWKTYLGNLYPVPAATQIPKYKRKFYRSKINPNLPEVAPQPSEGNTRSSNAAASSQATGQRRPYGQAAPSGLSQRIWKPIATVTLACAICCTVGSLLPLAFQPILNRLSTGLLGLGLIAATFSENGLPKMNMQYVQLLCYNTHVQALAMLLVGATMKIALTIYSPAITAAAFVAKQMNFSHPVLTRLVMNKPYLEILVGFIAIYAWLTRTTSFISMVLYWNTLRLLFGVSAPLKRAFANVNAGVLKFMAHPRVPAFIRDGYRSLSNWIWLKCEMP